MNNRERKEHAKSMKEFDRDYRKTKEGVWKQTRQYQTGSRKKVVIGLAGFFPDRVLHFYGRITGWSIGKISSPLESGKQL